MGVRIVMVLIYLLVMVLIVEGVWGVEVIIFSLIFGFFWYGWLVCCFVLVVFVFYLYVEWNGECCCVFYVFMYDVFGCVLFFWCDFDDEFIVDL